MTRWHHPADGPRRGLTVAGLIAELEKLPPDLPVIRSDDGEWYEVGGVYLEHGRRDPVWRWAEEDHAGAVPICFLGA